MKLPFFKALITTVVIITLTSCASREDIAYFQDEQNANYSQPVLVYDLVYQPNDMLTIDITALDPETVRPFNLNTVPSNNESSLEASNTSRMQTYIVGANGEIDFPVLGTIKIGGLNRKEATILLKNEITKYVKNPIVNIRLVNFTISVLGEVNNPGSFTIQDEKVTLTEALGLAGDLTIQGKRKNILLIRESNGIKKFSVIDLTSVKSLTTSTFNLMQNDVIYVEPNNARVRSSSFNQNNSIIISAVGTLATIVAILIR